MTIDEVCTKIREQSAGRLADINSHMLTLERALVVPERMIIIFRQVDKGRVTDEGQNVWLVGQENSTDGYRIIMKEDGSKFGLASPGFPADKHLILTGWYGNLLDAFLNM